MKKQKIIVDTSIWIEYFNNNTNIVNFIEERIMEDFLFMTGPIVTELLQGVKTEKEYEKLKNSIDAIPYLEITLGNWKKAGNISNKLRRKGIKIPLTDIIISAVAISNDAKVYSLDKHFEKIPAVKLFNKIK